MSRVLSSSESNTIKKAAVILREAERLIDSFPKALCMQFLRESS